jgi:PASTA domain
MPQDPTVEPGGPEPIFIVPAEPDPPAYTAPPADVAPHNEPTLVVPAVTYQPVVAPTPAVVPVAGAPVFADDRRPVWPYFVALLALIAGGVIGFLIGDARDDETSTQPGISQPFDTTAGSTPTAGDLQAQVDLLTAAQKKAEAELAALQASLTRAESERDALAAQVGDTDGTTPDPQAELAASKAEVARLQGDILNVTGQLDTANASLKTLQGQLDAANVTLAALHSIPLPNYINANIGRVRSEAESNGWTLVEQQSTTPSPNVGTVLEQQPEVGTNMVTGSLLFVTVA